jgi:hypothetical protein
MMQQVMPAMWNAVANWPAAGTGVHSDTPWSQPCGTDRLAVLAGWLGWLAWGAGLFSDYGYGRPHTHGK